MNKINQMNSSRWILKKADQTRSQASRNRRRTFPYLPVPELPRQLVSRVGYVEDFDEPRTLQGEEACLGAPGLGG